MVAESELVKLLREEPPFVKVLRREIRDAGVLALILDAAAGGSALVDSLRLSPSELRFLQQVK